MKYNKGEWSESYLIFKILEEGKINAGDSLGNAVLEEYYPIMKIIDYDNEIEYIINHDNSYNTQSVNIIDFENNILKEDISNYEISSISNESLEVIKGGKRTFNVQILEKFFKNIGIDSLKSPSSSKSDISLEIKDLKLEINKVLDYSIKSYLGSNPTILNASMQTNFEYEIKNISTQDLEAIRSINKDTESKWLKKRMGFILDNHDILFNKVISDTFDRNLKLIDTNLDIILSELLLIFYSNERVSSIKDLNKRLNLKDPLSIKDNELIEIFYKKKILDFIKASAFGMMPSEKWNGDYSVDGGMLVILKDGDVIVYHIQYDLKNLNMYLFNKTKLETPSHTRYGMTDIYSRDDKYYFTLNLQVRMR